MCSGHARAQTDDCNSSHFGPKIIKEINKLKELSATSRKYSSGSTFHLQHRCTVSQLRWWWGSSNVGREAPGRKHLNITPFQVLHSSTATLAAQRGTKGGNHTQADSSRELERILNKAEATGGFLDLVQPHDNPLDVSALGEELLDLLLGGVEGQVANIQRRGNFQGFLLQLPATLRAKGSTQRGEHACRPAPAARPRRAPPAAPKMRCPPARRLLARPCPGNSPPPQVLLHPLALAGPHRLGPRRPHPRASGLAAGRTRKCWSRYWLISQ